MNVKKLSEPVVEFLEYTRPQIPREDKTEMLQNKTTEQIHS